MGPTGALDMVQKKSVSWGNSETRSLLSYPVSNPPFLNVHYLHHSEVTVQLKVQHGASAVPTDGYRLRCTQQQEEAKRERLTWETKLAMFYRQGQERQLADRDTTTQCDGSSSK